MLGLLDVSAISRVFHERADCGVKSTSDVGTEARFARSNLYFSQSIQTATMVALTRQPSVSPPRTGWSPPRPAPTSG